MDKQRVMIMVKVLEEVQNQFPQTVDFVDEKIEEQCSKENMTKEQLIFLFTYQEFSPEKTFFIL